MEEKIIKEKNVTITTETFVMMCEGQAKLVEANTKLNIIQKILDEKKYISDDLLKCILTAKGGNENG